jgi:hypothetical protein
MATMEMDATGISRGEWVLDGDFRRAIVYLSDQKRIMRFNPFCHSVELTEVENVYKWHFRVTDPQNNPFDVLFFVEQIEELLLELPENMECSDPDDLTDEMIERYTVGKKIHFKHYPVSKSVEDPANYLFAGKVSADMYIHPGAKGKTKVHFDLKVEVTFLLYPAFRIIPVKVLRTMTKAGMSMIIQTASNKMFHSISKDFKKFRCP